MAQAKPALGLRPMLPADIPLLVEIFRASIEGLTGEDYSPGQQDAWASAADDEAAFAARLTQQLTLVGTAAGAPAGFASLKGADMLDMLYVHPALVRQGLATRLVDALEKLAGARGATRLTVDASDTAREFFAGRGFRAERRNTVPLAGEWLGNTTMVKPLALGPSEGEVKQ